MPHVGRLAARTISSASGRFIAIGFSHSTCFPPGGGEGDWRVQKIGCRDRSIDVIWLEEQDQPNQ